MKWEDLNWGFAVFLVGSVNRMALSARKKMGCAVKLLISLPFRQIRMLLNSAKLNKIR